MTEHETNTSVHGWVQDMLHTEETIIHELGETYEYYIDNVDALENGEFDYLNLPKFDETSKLLIHWAVLFGIEWGTERAELFVVSEDGKFAGLFASPVNAFNRVSDEFESIYEEIEEEVSEAMSEEELDDLAREKSNELPIERVSPQADAVGEIDEALTQNDEFTRNLMAYFEFLYNNIEEIESGDISPVEFSGLEENLKWVLAYSAIFGQLWECSHPGLFVVLDNDEKFVELFGTKKNADEYCEGVTGGRVKRVNVEDGELPNEIVLSSDLKD